MVDQRGQVDPALTRVPDRSRRRDRCRVDTRYPHLNFIWSEQVTVVTLRQLMSMDLADGFRFVIGLPVQPTVEPQPVLIRMMGEESSVAVDSDHAQAVIVLGADGGRVEPGQRSAGRAAGQRALGRQAYLGAAAGEMVGAGDPDDASADNRNSRLRLIAHGAD